MPNCFTLTPKVEGPKAKPAKFPTIDDAIREHFGAPEDPKRYYYGWYDSIGLLLSMGKSFDDMRQKFGQHIECPREGDIYVALIQVVDYLDERYTSRAWYSPR